MLHIGLFHPQLNFWFSQSIYSSGRLNTVDLLVLSSLDQLLLVIKNYLPFYKKAILVLHIGLFHPKLNFWFSQSIYWRSTNVCVNAHHSQAKSVCECASWLGRRVCVCVFTPPVLSLSAEKSWTVIGASKLHSNLKSVRDGPSCDASLMPFWRMLN